MIHYLAHTKKEGFLMDLFLIPAYQDNYLWLMHHSKKRLAVVVDPGDAEPTLHCLKKLNAKLAAIVLTHHHHDHVGGVECLLSKYDCPVYGPQSDTMPWVTNTVSDGDTFHLPVSDQPVSVLAVPGHTLEHVAYLHQGRLFCGDTLFAGGCGRLLGGTAEMLHDSLKKIARLPSDTMIYCAHEYTLVNLCFAQTIDVDNPLLNERLQAVIALRELGQPTVPSRLGDELNTNPFLRCHVPAIKERVEALSGEALADELAVFRALRDLKDEFRCSL